MSIVIVALIVVAIAAAATLVATPVYSATARLFVTTTSSDTSVAYQGGTFAAQRVTSYADLVDSRELATTVIANLALDEPPGDLADHVSATVNPNTVNFTISVTDPDPERAQGLTQAYAEAMVDLVRQLETPNGLGSAPVKATIVDPASLPGQPESPRPTRNLSLALIVGLLLGFGLAVARELFDTSLKSPDDISGLVPAPLLGSIAFDPDTRDSPLVTSLDPHSPRIEAFRVLRTNLQFVDVDNTEKVFVVSSAVPEEGKTTTAVNLAITLAQAGNRTLLIEADLRRPRASAMLGMDHATGVTTVLLGRISLDDALQEQTASDLHVLSAGAIPPNPADLLQSKAMADLLARVRTLYDVVIIDAPPLLPVTDAALLASQSDGALLVVRHGSTTRDQLVQAYDRLTQVDAKLVGVLFNMVPSRRGYGYGDGYGYGYGYAPADSTGVIAPVERPRWGAFSTRRRS